MWSQGLGPGERRGRGGVVRGWILKAVGTIEGVQSREGDTTSFMFLKVTHAGEKDGWVVWGQRE